MEYNQKIIKSVMLSKIIQQTFSTVKHKLTLVRNGETIWNKDKKWVGWVDIPLSSFGIKEIKECAKLLKTNGEKYDIVYTSVLGRAIKSTNYILDELDIHYVPVVKDWRLNQKHYGALQGFNKIQMNEKHGEKTVMQWRASLNVRPPPLDVNHQTHPANNPLYKQIPRDQLPSSECLMDVVKRISPLWQENISKDVKSGKNVLVVAHGSSLRALIYKIIPSLKQEEIKIFNIPSAVPIVLSLDENMKVLNFDYLGDESQIQAKINKIIYETQKSDVV